MTKDLETPPRKPWRRLILFALLTAAFVAMLVGGVYLGDNADMAIEASTL